MKRSKVIALLNAIEVPGEDDPEIEIEHTGLDYPIRDLDDCIFRKCVHTYPPKSTNPPLTMAERNALHKDNGAISFLFRPDNPNMIPFGELILLIEEAFEPMMQYRLDPYLIAVLTEKATDIIRSLYAARKFCMPFDGVRITVGKAFKKTANTIGIEFITEWMPHARYDNADPTWMPLGFLREFDLYYAMQKGLPPTLIIKDGHGAEGYASYNPFLIDTLPRLEMYRVALQRAAMVNNQFSERYQKLKQ